MTTEGMKLDQLVAMLQAAMAQGATHVRIASKDDAGGGIASDIDWVSMEPVEQGRSVYIGAILPLQAWEHASNEALESLDW